ncbi:MULTISPECIES: hypothetical protein [Streptomyces]|uniref:hypothetical protein n=1 Tax=Streptomyces TaxID=1883 RepID=UPI001EFA7EE4|nr:MULTISPECIES: hypothetical protein [Streptomyces]ULR53884.1 hypothetical protein L3078_33940 [Streptomyces deccanensis]
MTDLTFDDALTAEDIHRAVHSLARLTAHLRTGPENTEAAALLAPLVHAAPALIDTVAQVLREVSRLLAQHADVPWDATVTDLVREYLDAATAVDQLRNPLSKTLSLLEQAPIRTVHGDGGGSGTCR